MKSMFVLIVSMLVSAAGPGAQSHAVRPLDTVAAEAFALGLRRSDTFLELVAQLERSDLIVHVVTSRDLPSTLTGTTRFVAERGHARYVRIAVAARLSPTSRVSVIGHELQHALEIASSGAHTNDAVLAFYQAAGRKASTVADGWETTAAEAIERRIWIEMNSRGHTTARAVE